MRILFLGTAVGLFLSTSPVSAADLNRPPVDKNPLVDPSTLAVALLLGAAAYAGEDSGENNNFEGMLDVAPLDVAIDAGDRYGAGATLGIAAVSVFALGTVTGDPKLLGLGADLIPSLALAWSTTWILKLSVDAARADGGRYSFPSGPTAGAFAAAPVLNAHFGTTVGIISYSIASLTGLARLEENKHYLSDVLVGAAIGITSGRLFTRKVSVAPTLTTDGTALKLSYRF